ncbi:MAG: hypothetical protein HOV80_16620 [Polyangiaceae bacterium]|nr:hypothetical protein [Polyangiaceae bacterium]
MLTPCQTLCASPAAQCVDGDCAALCAGVYQPGCEAEADALILCFAQYVAADCQIGSDCDQSQVAYDACVSGQTDCQDFDCQSQDTSCDCYGQCFGTNLEQVCYATPNQIQCDCFGDFGLIGTCSQPNLSCSLDSGCCKQFFFDG